MSKGRFIIIIFVVVISTALFTLLYSIASETGIRADEAHLLHLEDKISDLEAIIGDLNEIAFSGDYSDLNNKPNLFSGNYNDLTNQPSLFSGNYWDLNGVPNHWDLIVDEDFSGYITQNKTFSLVFSIEDILNFAGFFHDLYYIQIYATDDILSTPVLFDTFILPIEGSYINKLNKIGIDINISIQWDLWGGVSITSYNIEAIHIKIMGVFSYEWNS